MAKIRHYLQNVEKQVFELSVLLFLGLSLHGPHSFAIPLILQPKKAVFSDNNCLTAALRKLP